MGELVRPDTVWVLIPITGIVGGLGIAAYAIWIKHRERMAMIEQGLHPDSLDDIDPDQLESGEAPAGFELRSRDRERP